MKKDIKLVFEDGIVWETLRGITVWEILKKINNNQVIGLRINGRAVPINYEIMSNSVVKFITIDSRIGRKIYMKGLQFMYLLAIYDIFGDYTCVNIKHSLDKAIYTELNTKKTIDGDLVKKIKSKMREIVNRDIPIKKISSSREDVIAYTKQLNEPEKVLNYTFMTSDYVSLYELDDIYNYFYYFMPASTGILNRFDLTFVEPNGIVLSYPVNNVVPKYNPSPKVLESFRKYEDKLSKVGVNYAGDINKLVVDGKIKDFIQTNELIYDEQITDIVNTIEKNSKIKAIFLSGPSSSGKTTTSRKISLMLKSRGINSLIVSTDDYFLEREETPKDEDGNYDFEVIQAIDCKLLISHLKKLIKREKVNMPTYNFLTGEKEYKKGEIELADKQILIVEGLHAINDKITDFLDKKEVLKIYISPFTPVSLDRHNHISTTDVRLLRRMVRDNRNRGYNATATLEKWTEMRKSEEKNVYPYQRVADVVFNSSLAYEIGVLRTYAEPLLYSVSTECPHYEEAVRILNFLKGFISINSEDIPTTSVLREFIGNSYFE